MRIVIGLPRPGEARARPPYYNSNLDFLSLSTPADSHHLSRHRKGLKWPDAWRRNSARGGSGRSGVNLAQPCCIGGPRHRRRRAHNERALRSPGASCACEAGKDTLMALEAA